MIHRPAHMFSITSGSFCLHLGFLSRCIEWFIILSAYRLGSHINKLQRESNFLQLKLGSITNPFLMLHQKTRPNMMANLPHLSFSTFLDPWNLVSLLICCTCLASFSQLNGEHLVTSHVPGFYPSPSISLFSPCIQFMTLPKFHLLNLTGVLWKMRGYEIRN